MGDETRNRMMKNLFGDQSSSSSEEEEEEDDDDEEEEEVDSAAAAAAANKKRKYYGYRWDEGEDEAENYGEGESQIEGPGEVEVESEAESHDINVHQERSKGRRFCSSSERELSKKRMESEPTEIESDDYGQKTATSRRRKVVASESEESEDNKYADHQVEDAESDGGRKPRSVDEQEEPEVVRDVFGSSEDEPAEDSAQDEIEHDLHKSLLEVDEEVKDKDLPAEDIIADGDRQNISEDENLEEKRKDKPVGPPLNMEIPLQLPPGRPDRMKVIKVSNIMGIAARPFDPKTHVEEDVLVTDESGARKHIRLEDNIVRWRMVKNRDGTVSHESNARLVRWKDGSLQLLIGSEVLDISVHDGQHDQSHLFLRHAKGILLSQGRLLRKMRFMPSSLSSKSHRLLTALVDSWHKKVYKVKNCITDIDPEREKEEKERVEGQTIRANEVLHRKREKVNHKYSLTAKRGRQLSPGFLEDAVEEVDEPEEYYESRRASGRCCFDEDLEAEAKAEKRIINAKRSNIHTNIRRKPSFSATRTSRHQLKEYSDSRREESEYESDGDERLPPNNEPDYEDDVEEDPSAKSSSEEDEDVDSRRKRKETGVSTLKHKARKMAVHRRKSVVFDSDEE